MALSSNFTRPTETVLSAPATTPTTASPEVVERYADTANRDTGLPKGALAPDTSGSVDARTIVADAMRAFGLDGLADWIMQNIVEGTDVTTVYLNLRKTEEYKKRFPAMEELQRQAAAGGRGYNESDYINIENAYRETLSQSGLPPEMWDSADDYANLMKAQVSPTEVQRRVDAAKQAVMSTDPATRASLQRLYGIGTTDLMGYALVPDRGSEYIQRMATTAIMAGMGADAGLGTGLGAAQWERYAGEAIQSNTGYGEIRGQIASAKTLAQEQSRLTGIEGQPEFTDTDALDVAVLKDVQKGLASEQRAKRERARFAGSSGISGGTLRGSSAL